LGTDKLLPLDSLGSNGYDSTLNQEQASPVRTKFSHPGLGFQQEGILPTSAAIIAAGGGAGSNEGNVGPSPSVLEFV